MRLLRTVLQLSDVHFYGLCSICFIAVIFLEVANYKIKNTFKIKLRVNFKSTFTNNCTLVKNLGRLEQRIQQRKEKIVNVLPTNPSEGKTYEEIANEVGYSVATVRADLDSLEAEKCVKCDDSRRPYKWYKVAK